MGCITKSLAFATEMIHDELSKEFISTALDENKLVELAKFKVTPINVFCLTIRVYYKLNIYCIESIETFKYILYLYFGELVTIFDNNLIWLGKALQEMRHLKFLEKD